MMATGKCGWAWIAAWLLSASPALGQRQIAEPDAPAPLAPVAGPIPTAEFAPPPGGFDIGPPAVAPLTAPAFAGPAGADRVRITLADNSQLIGEVPKDAKFDFKSRFGKLALNVDEVAKIDPANESQFTVTLENGDRMTGEVAFGELKLKTAFGEVPLDREDFAGLEVGKLYEQRVAIVRPSPDGRTTTTVFRNQKLFQPNTPSTGTVNPYTSYGVPAAATYFAPTEWRAAPRPTLPSPRPE
jgi:hypothetical protein